MPATIQEPTAPSAERNRIAPANPHAPAQVQRERSASPQSRHSSNTRSAAIAVRITIGAIGRERSRFHAQAADSTGTPKAATCPNTHTSP